MNKDRTFTKPLTCAQCGLTFALDTCLAAHKTIEHLERPPHSCTVCKLAFFSSIAYNDHLVRHSLQRDSPSSYYKCSECGLDFPSEHGMRVHLSTHTGLSVQSRGNASVRRYNVFHCPLCPKQLVGRKLYHEHIRMHKRQKLTSDEPSSQHGADTGGAAPSVCGQ
ncbi:zinc finger E-box-binding homeobox 1-like [Babylonia areolata]|uniref:zinc finger E-box-binding homeobox 1-like n=1 Tax=Babylonia areolata TaxID=304850 RepID=UPI003FD59095